MALPKADRRLNSTPHFSPFNCCLSVVFCSLGREITPKVCMLCFVLIVSVLLNLLCAWILFYNASRHSCFKCFRLRMLAVILGSDFSFSLSFFLLCLEAQYQHAVAACT